MAEVTEREFDLLRESVQQANNRIDRLDNPAAPMAALQVQFSELVKDVGDLKLDFAGHVKQHKDEEVERKAGRRWLIGTAIAVVVALCAILTLLIYALSVMPLR